VKTEEVLEALEKEAA